MWISHKYNISLPSRASLLTPHPTPLSHPRSQNWVPCYEAASDSCLLYPWQCMYVSTTLICPAFSFPHWVHGSVLYICVSIPTLFFIPPLQSRFQKQTHHFYDAVYVYRSCAWFKTSHIFYTLMDISFVSKLTKAWWCDFNISKGKEIEVHRSSSIYVSLEISKEQSQFLTRICSEQI